MADQPGGRTALAILAKEGLDSRGRIINTTSGAGLVGLRPDQLRHRQGCCGGPHSDSGPRTPSPGVTVNAIGPAGATRITGTMPNAPTVVEPDEIAEDDSTLGPQTSPVVAWLASDDAQRDWSGYSGHRRQDPPHGRMARSRQRSNDGKRWDASKVGDVFATQIFGSQDVGCRLGQIARPKGGSGLLLSRWDQR